MAGVLVHLCRLVRDSFMSGKKEPTGSRAESREETDLTDGFTTSFPPKTQGVILGEISGIRKGVLGVDLSAPGRPLPKLEYSHPNWLPGPQSPHP